jgi:hypothetical protein
MKMGTRTVFQILDGDRNLIATLFANSSHTTQFAETVFDSNIKDSANRGGPNALIEKLLSLRYETDEGAHQMGERIFWLVPADEAELGDNEAIIKVTHGGVIEELVTKGYVPLAGSAWCYERMEA